MDFKDSLRFRESIEAFDALNAQDPNRVELTELTEQAGQAVPKELHDAHAMTRWIDTLYPDASEAVHLAARCQHLCRWEVPRDSYPEGRKGYLEWRADLKAFHAEKSAKVLRANGYDTPLIEAVTRINLKQGLKANPDVQQIEDALCLVFLENQFESYIDQWEEAKIVRILQKTWAKMSECGHQAALKLKLSKRANALVQMALS